MKLKMLMDKYITSDVYLERGKSYEIEDIIQDTYKIKIPMKQKGKFRYALVKDEEGVLVE